MGLKENCTRIGHVLTGTGRVFPRITDFLLFLQKVLPGVISSGKYTPLTDTRDLAQSVLVDNSDHTSGNIHQPFL